MTGTVLTVDGGMMARANMPIRQKPPKPALSTADKNDSYNPSASSNVVFEIPTVT
jgi:hypothetical protein